MNIEISKKETTCPLCQYTFDSTRVATTRLKLLKTDTDLRPYYNGIDTIPYEITTCESCGYSTYYNEFKLKVDDKDATKLNEILTKSFKSKKFPEKLSNKDGIEKYKLAILVANSRETEKSVLSNLYMKLGWLFRNEDGCQKFEDACIKNSYNLGKEAFKIESFPVMGINKSTFSYLLGDMARRLSLYDEATRWLKNSKSLQESSITLKSRADEVLAIIDECTKQN